MANTRLLQRSFAGGEMSPEMFGRVDDAKFQTGAARVRNFIVTPQGPVENRPGFELVREVKDSSKSVRLIPFSFSQTQTTIIEAGDGYFRFHSNGQTVFPNNENLISNNEFTSDLDGWVDASSSSSEVKWSSSFGGSALFVDVFGSPILTHTLDATAGQYVIEFVFNKYVSSLDLEIGTTAGGNDIVNLSASDLVFDAGVYKIQRTVTLPDGTLYLTIEMQETAYMLSGSVNAFNESPYEIETPYLEAELFDLNFVQSSDVVTIVHQNHPPKELRRLGAADWELVTINFGAPIAAPTGLSVTPYIPASTSTNVDTYADMNYVVTAIADDDLGESAASASATASNNIFVTGAKNTITWNAVTGAVRYQVYKEQGGIYGYIGYTTGTTLVDDNIQPDFSITPPIYDNEFTGAGNYPGAVSYFEQRRCFAGTINDPQKVWMTKSGTESNLSYGIPVNDDDRIEFKVAAREANTILHLAPLNNLIMLTGSAEWKVDANITPTSISVSPQSYIGATRVQPIIVNNTMIFPAARGGHVRELGYSFQVGGYVTNDVSIRSGHLFDRKEIVNMAYAKSPLPIVWMVNNEGLLIGMTYVPDQQVGAIHWHDTDGAFESCASVAEGIEDSLYVVTRRTINGQTKRFIERMKSREFDSVENSFFVDCGLTYNGVNATSTTVTLSGGTTWQPGEQITITASNPIFDDESENDIGDAIVVGCDNGQSIRLVIDAVTSSTVATAYPDYLIAAELRNTALLSWSFARNTISGLNHLEGKEVSILADGSVHPVLTVTDGAITLQRSACIVHVGLGYNSDLQTLPVQLQIEAFAQGRMKNINNAWLRVYRSSGIFVGPDENNLVEAKQRTTENYGAPPTLKTEEVKIFLTPTWSDSGQVFIRQSDPLPLTLISMTLEASIGG